jgi:hypothetical protein
MVVCDIGRDSQKIICSEGKKQFKSFYSYVDFSRVKRLPILQFKEDEGIIATINNGSPICFGDACNKISPPDEILYASEDSIFLEKSIDYILVSIALCLKSDCDDVKIAVALTDKQIERIVDLEEKLMGNKHNIKFWIPQEKISKEINFQIITFLYFPQGWAGFMDLAIDKDFNVIPEFVEKQSLVIGGGRKSVDVNLIIELSPVKQKTYDLGTEYFFKSVQDILFRDYKLTKTTIEIEKFYSRGKAITKSGKPINMIEISNRASKQILEDLKTKISNDFGQYSPDQIIAFGGWTYIFQKQLEQMFDGIIFSEDRVFSEANGLWKMLYRKCCLQKKGM